jgi:hypothetical protein
LGIEKRAEAELLPFMQKAWPGCTYYPTRHHRLIQLFCGDVLVSLPKEAKYIELKAEESDRHGNLFIETWSNKARKTRGWFWKCQADWLWYYFLEQHELYVFEMDALRTWLTPQLQEKYPEKAQRKRDQLNDTWGLCIPIEDMRSGVDGFFGPINPIAT